MSDSIKGTNLTWHASEVSAERRREVHGHGGAVLWLTGLSGSGKSTLAHRVERLLLERGVFAYVLDGDNVRHRLNRDLTFSAEDRSENIRRVSEVAKLFQDSGAVVITAFISPYRADRAQARETVGDAFFEVHLDVDVDTCEVRDPKGLYKKARAGEIKNFTGISAPYEAPESPEIKVRTGEEPVEASAAKVLAMLEDRGVIAAG